MKNRTNVRAFFLLLLAGGCAQPLPVGAEAEPIIGGTTDTGDPGVVLVRASDQSGYSLCTGEVVSPHVIMTAAHCTNPSEVGQGETFDVFIGNNFNGAEGQDASKWLAVQATHYNPSFNGNSLGNGQDVGVVILENATSIAPLPMNRTALTQSLVGQAIRIVGFGNNNGQQGTGAGLKRAASTPLSSYSTKFVNFGDSQHDTCQGDSGGPAFMTIGGVEVIVGVTSYGAVGCTGGATDTRVDTVAAQYVDPYIQQYDPQTSPPDLGSAPADLGHAPADLAPAATSDAGTGGGGNGGGNNGNGDDGSVGGNNGNGGGGNQNGNGDAGNQSGNGDAGHVSLTGGSDQPGARAVGGCTLGGRSAYGSLYGLGLLLALAVAIRRRGRARY